MIQFDFGLLILNNILLVMRTTDAKLLQTQCILVL